MPLWDDNKRHRQNVVANYPFERSHRFAGIQPNSGPGDHSRLSCSAGIRSSGWVLPGLLSMLVDTALLLGLIWAFHFQYEQPAVFSLKVPTFVYIFAFIALRALRFDHRYCLRDCSPRAAGRCS